MPTQRGALVGIGVVCAALVGGLERPALAQVTAPRELPGAVEPGRDRPLPQAPVQPDFDFTIESPSRSQVPRAVEELRFLLQGIEIEGAVAIPPAALEPLYRDLIGKEVSVSSILDVADAIEDTYRRAGYVLTHAFVPPQRVRNGVFTINVVEGYVETVSVEGGDPATQALIKAYLLPVVAARPLTQAAIERALLLANDLPGVTASGVLRPAPNVPGASELVVTLTEVPLYGGLAVDNRGSLFSGVWTLGGDVEANSLWGAGDQLAASYASSPNALEKTSSQVVYRRPVGSDGMVASLAVTLTHGQPGASLAPIDLVTNSYAVGPRLLYPLLRSRAETLQLDGGITVQDARVTALGLPLTHDQWRVADLSASYARVALGGSWASTFDVARGIGVFGATPDGSPNLSPVGHGSATDFTKLTATLHHTRPLVGKLSLAVSAQAQDAFMPLVAGEQITFGGAQIGRGYDPGAITGDRGAGGSIELRWDERYPAIKLEAVEPYLYYETAKVWSVHPGSNLTQAIASTGVGIRVSLPYAITGDVELARTLRAVPGSDSGVKATKVLMDAAIRF